MPKEKRAGKTKREKVTLAGGKGSAHGKRSLWGAENYVCRGEGDSPAGKQDPERA